MWKRRGSGFDLWKQKGWLLGSVDSKDGKWEACVSGTRSTIGFKMFASLEAAKAYVERASKAQATDSVLRRVPV